MSPKEKFDACMKQADSYNQNVYNRQGYQWKVTIGLWTVLILGTGFLFGKHIPRISWWFSCAIPLVYAFTWVRGVAITNYNDQQAAHHFRMEAEALLLDDAHEVLPLPAQATTIGQECFLFATVWAHQFEILATVVIVFAATALLNSNCPIP